MNYGRVLKKYRKLSGFSQEDMAANLRMQQSCISKIENGHRGMDLVTFIGWVQLMSNREALLREIGLLDGYAEEPIQEEYKGIFFEVVKKEMLLQQHL